MKKLNFNHYLVSFFLLGFAHFKVIVLKDSQFTSITNALSSVYLNVAILVFELGVHTIFKDFHVLDLVIEPLHINTLGDYPLLCPWIYDPHMYIFE